MFENNDTNRFSFLEYQLVAQLWVSAYRKSMMASTRLCKTSLTTALKLPLFDHIDVPILTGREHELTLSWNC